MYGRRSAKIRTLWLRWRWLSGMSMTRVGVIILSIAASAATLPYTALADPAALPRGQDRTSPYMRVFGVTQPPYGFVEFCQRMPGVQTGAAGGTALFGEPRAIERTARH